MTGVLVGFSMLVALVGFLLLSNATAGVGVIAGAILLAIYARIRQAHEHHLKLPHVREQAERDRQAVAAYVASLPPRAPTTRRDRFLVIAVFLILAAMIVAAMVASQFQ